MGQADLARPHRRRPAADQRDRRCAVVGRPERRLRDQPTLRQDQPGRRVDPADLDRLAPGERRQDPRQSLGQHRLARPRRPDEQQVVAAGRRHLDRPPADPLAPDVGQVQTSRSRSLRRRHRVRWRRPALPAGQHVDQLTQARAPIDRAGADRGGFRVVAPRHDQRVADERVGQRDDARHVPERAVQPELADERQAVERAGREHPRGGQQPDGDRQVQPRPALPHP